MEYPLNPPEPPKIRVVLAYNHRLVRQVIKILLQQTDDIEIVGETRDGLEAVQLTESLHPDVLVIGVNTADISGLEVTTQIQQRRLATQVVILSAYQDEIEELHALNHGASRYLPTLLIPAELLPAIRQAYHHQVYQNYGLVLG
jgi:DNA-binding NarL/FixJ family response regulator